MLVVKVDKMGDIKIYINKPVLDKFTTVFDFNKPSKTIGVIADAIELDDCFELHIVLWRDKINVHKEFIGNELNAITIRS